MDNPMEPVEPGGPVVGGAPSAFERDWVAPDQRPTRTEVLTPEADDGEPVRRPPDRLPSPLRPMTMADLIDGAFVVLKARPRTVLLIAAVFTVPVQMLAAWLQRSELSELNQMVTDPSGFVLADSGSSLPTIQAFLVIYLTLLPLPYVGAAIARLVAGWYAGTDPTFGEVLRDSMLPWKWLWLFLAWLPIHLIEGVALVAFLLPALFVMTLFQVVAPVISLENVGPARGAVRSVQLVSRRYWWIVLVVLLTGLLSWAVTQSLTLIPTFVAALVPEQYGWLVYGLGQSAGALVLTPVVTSVSVLVYLDLRIRTEGLDLELKAARAFATT